MEAHTAQDGTGLKPLSTTACSQTQGKAPPQQHQWPDLPELQEQEAVENLPSPPTDAEALMADRGKRTASSPANSPSKTPLAKKHHWAASDTINQSSSHISTLATIPVTDNPVSATMLKSMLLTLQKDLHRELQISLSPKFMTGLTAWKKALMHWRKMSVKWAKPITNSLRHMTITRLNYKELN